MSGSFEQIALVILFCPENEYCEIYLTNQEIVHNWLVQWCDVIKL